MKDRFLKFEKNTAIVGLFSTSCNIASNHKIKIVKIFTYGMQEE
jgi:hypothetical protein